jgi:Zn-dependent protease
VRREASRGTFTLLRLPVGQGRALVPLRIHWTLLLAIPYLAAAFLVQFGTASHGAIAPREGYALGVALALSLFLAVFLHELCHTVVGVRLGAAVRAITLMFLGGVSEMSTPPSTAAGEVAMAAAGPAASLAIAAVAWGLGRTTHGLPQVFLLLFAQLNLVIGIFNLLPAFPLDGGRVLRGLLALRLGTERATRVAARIGQVLAVLLGMVGLFFGGLLLTLIAVFIFVSATAESRATILETRLRRVPVGALMEPPTATVSDEATVEEAAARLGRLRGGALLVEHEGNVVGEVQLARVRAVPYAYRSRTPVHAIMVEPPAAIAPDAPASEALRRMREQSVEELPVVEDRRLIGVVRLAEMDRWAERDGAIP